ncbi:MAG: GatB/YqeY domain-containing protein [Patescibacteria group bacterium]|mgnify:CR=1 FL=1
MLVDELKRSVIASLKQGSTRRVETLRFLLAAVQYTAIAKYGSDADTKLTDQDVLDSIKKQAKAHRESISAFQKAGREKLVTKEQEELAILEEYLPKQLSDKEIETLLAPLITSEKKDLPAGRQDFGKLMGQAMTAVKGQADGGRVSAILKQMLSSS